MTGSIDPVRRAQPSRRAADRRGDDRREAERRVEAAEAEAGGPPVPAAPVIDHDPAPQALGPGAFSAQLFGQSGEKRGLRGGPPVLESARSAYLEAQFLGPTDRRMRKGKITKTEI